MIHRYISEKMQRCHDYVLALEEERRKVEVFQRELPLCLELVTQAIETCKQQLSGATTDYNLHNQSETSEQTSSVPILEEFITINKASSELNEQDYCINLNKDEGCSSRLDMDSDDINENNNSKKSDWLRSVQLWNQTPDPTPIEEGSPEEDVNVPHNEEDKIDPNTSNPPTLTSSGVKNNCDDNNKNKNKEKEWKSQRKTRRCWSPELHKRFVQALKQLGGSHVATPKQIRELMKVDELTNDEVKSHLQKYRLHNRKPSMNDNSNSATAQAPQFVVVGGIWMPPEYSIVCNTTTGESSKSGTIPASDNGIYTPIASLAQPLIQESNSLPSPKQRTDRRHNLRGCCHKDRSKVASSSTHHTTTAC